MKGKTVIVKVFTGEMVRRKIWSVGQNVVYVTDEKNYELLTEDKPAVIPVGVPKADVFEEYGTRLTV